MKTIVLTGGGTAGHVTPNLALIPRLRKDGWDIHYIGAVNGVEKELVENLPGVTYHGVAVGKLRRYIDLKNLSDPFRVIKGVAQATSIIRKLKPNVVFSKGGFVSVPVVYGAKLNGVPIVIHESDMTPGLANKLCAPFAKVECCTFPEAVKYTKGKGIYTGTPLRPEIYSGSRENGMKRFGLKGEKPVLMIVGGSSGARAINEAVAGALTELSKNFEIIHLCGKGNLSAALIDTPNYHAYEYLNEEMPDAYAAADIIVSRAGANALCEILACRKPALLIPYPLDASRGDQVMNAASFEKRGFSRVLDQSELTPERLVEEVVALYHARGDMWEKMRADKTQNGLDKVLEQIYKFAR